MSSNYPPPIPTHKPHPPIHTNNDNNNDNNIDDDDDDGAIHPQLGIDLKPLWDQEIKHAKLNYHTSNNDANNYNNDIASNDNNNNNDSNSNDGPSLYIGVDYELNHTDENNDIPAYLALAVNNGFDYLAIPLFKPLNNTLIQSSNSIDLSIDNFECTLMSTSIHNLTDQHKHHNVINNHENVDNNTTYISTNNNKYDNYFTDSNYIRYLTGKVCRNVALDSQDATVRKQSQVLFQYEINYAQHIGLTSILLPPPNINSSNNNYMRILNSTLNNNKQSCEFWLPISIDSWSIWSQFYITCDYNKQLYVALIIDTDLPQDESIIKRWLGEPIKLAIININIFISDNQGNPQLTTTHKQLLLQLFDYNIQVLLQSQDNNDIDNLTNCLEYVRDLYNNHYKPTLSVRELYEYGFRDYLQSPLQPLQDNLQSSVYSVFEQDPVKYKQYQLAIQQALTDLMNTDKSYNTDNKLILLVVGGGRGPLVNCALRACNILNILDKIHIYCIEKNANAIITLKAFQIYNNEWKKYVTVVHNDMRNNNKNYNIKCDILISELLGSFGDNELSPECLDGCTQYIKPNTISIPQNSISYLTPISYSKGWNSVKDYSLNNIIDYKYFETSFVVKLHNYYQLSKDIKPVFTFDYTKLNQDNNRYAVNEYIIDKDSIIYGFGGYFYSKLYGDIYLSTHPQNANPYMFSWFPIYFPLRQPMFVKSNTNINLAMWRMVDENSRKVWYEWALINNNDSNYTTTIHNVNARSSYIGL